MVFLAVTLSSATSPKLMLPFLLFGSFVPESGLRVRLAIFTAHKPARTYIYIYVRVHVRCCNCISDMLQSAAWSILLDSPLGSLFSKSLLSCICQTEQVIESSETCSKVVFILNPLNFLW